MPGFTRYPAGATPPLSLLVFWCAFCLTAAPAAAQVDSDPSNDDQATADALPLTGHGTAVSNLANLAGAGNDVDHFRVDLAVGDVLLGMTTPVQNLPDDFDGPDTIAGVTSVATRRTFSEDDGAGELPSAGLARGSLWRFRNGGPGVRGGPPVTVISVSGFGDNDFDGAAGDGHTQAGRYVLTAGRVNPATPGGGFNDTDPANQSRINADPISVAPGLAAVAVSALAPTPLDFPNDVDFYSMMLPAGSVVSAMTAPLASTADTFDDPDTVLALFDDAGNRILFNDDAGDIGGNPDDDTLDSDFPTTNDDPLGSALRGLIPADGVYYLAVSGVGDEDFDGLDDVDLIPHGVAGRYALLVGVALPEPAAGAFFLVAVAALLGRGRGNGPRVG